MQWHDYIFSEERRFRVIRHVAFWVSWWLYFLFSYLLLQQPVSGSKFVYVTPGDHVPVKTFLLVLLFAITCYPVIYYIFPDITKGKWLKATAGIILMGAFLSTATYVLYWNIFSFIDVAFGSSMTSNPGTKLWPAVNLGLMNFVKVAAAALIIKYTKYWWLKQKENERLEKARINTELRLLKAQVHPDFLFKTLNSIYSHALSFSPRTSGLLLKLSDLLSYMLYECDRSTVPLEKEIDMVREYMQLEKIRCKDGPEIQISIRGDLKGKCIAPFLLTPFIENSFKHCNQVTEQFWINMDIQIEENNFSMRLANGISGMMTDQAGVDDRGLAKVQKRLTLLYPGKHELKMITEQEMSIVLLSIRLEDVADMMLEEEEADLVTSHNDKPIRTALRYATD